jgi:hypothetical protein
MLLNHSEVVWIGSTSNFADAKENILRLRPDTILVEETDEDASTLIIEILEASPCGGRVVSLNLNDNQLSVYHREERTLLHSGDLLQLILNDPKKMLEENCL